MESTLQKPALVAAKTTPKAKTIVYWIVTALFCLQMSFTAYAQLRLPQVAEAFTHLGFPAYFRMELSWAKLLGEVNQSVGEKGRRAEAELIADLVKHKAVDAGHREDSFLHRPTEQGHIRKYPRLSVLSGTGKPPHRDSVDCFKGA